jgi:simple sugar transport system permease protein
MAGFYEKQPPLFNAFVKIACSGPLVALALIFIFNRDFFTRFFKLGIFDGHLFGNLVDVFNNAAPLMLVALGMTLVIATGGVDLSVGAVIAISAGMGAVLINPVFGNEEITNAVAADPTLTNTPLWLVVVVTLGAGTCAVCGTGCWFHGQNRPWWRL